MRDARTARCEARHPFPFSQNALGLERSGRSSERRILHRKGLTMAPPIYQ